MRQEEHVQIGQIQGDDDNGAHWNIFSVNFHTSFTLFYKNMVRSQLDYCSSVWSPYRKCDIEALEKVQKKATKILPQVKNLKYEDRLKACKLPTLYFRRI